MGFITSYLTIHLVWTVILVINCGIKFVWFYDWSMWQDVLAMMFVALGFFYETIIIKRQKAAEKVTAIILLVYDIIISIILVLFPFLLGVPTNNYIIWNMVIPATTICTSVFIRMGKTD